MSTAAKIKKNISTTDSKKAKGRPKAANGNKNRNKNKTQDSRTHYSRINNSKKNIKQDKEEIRKLDEFYDRRTFEIVLVMIITAIFGLICYISMFGMAGDFSVFFGGALIAAFGWIAWVFPVLLFFAVVFVKVNGFKPKVIRRLTSGCGVVISLASITDLLSGAKTITENYDGNRMFYDSTSECLHQSFSDTLYHGSAGGGLLGRGIAGIFSTVLGKVGACIILIALLFLCLYIFYGVETIKKIRKRNDYYRKMERQVEVVRKEKGYERPDYSIRRKRPDNKIISDRVMQSINIEDFSKKYDMQQMEEKHENEKSKRIKNLTENNKRKKQIDELEEEQGIAATKLTYKTVIPNRPGGVRRSRRTESEASVKPDENAQNIKDEYVDNKKIYEPLTPVKPTEKTGSDVNVMTEENKEPEIKKKRRSSKSNKTIAREGEIQAIAFEEKNKISNDDTKEYRYPDMDLLNRQISAKGSVSYEELEVIKEKLYETLKVYGLDVTMGDVTCGPRIIRFEVHPDLGVSVKKFSGLQEDIMYSLGAEKIRIEAPIPGKSAVGIEIPNPASSVVGFRELLESDEFQSAQSPVSFAVGKDISGRVVVADVAKMPHLLIAGATGAGKSVCINTLIMSILYKANPKDVKLIMIDPKVVELSVYNGIPHLFCPVVTDPKEAAAALNWAVREMMDRYDRFKELGVRHIEGYNRKIDSLPKESMETAKEKGYEKMCNLVVIVDEFADLMMVASKEVETAVCRIAQLARAAGIHLILATQRPSRQVVTGLIKANIPSRIAFAVSSGVDSRIILDRTGAEDLLGKGDMMYFPAGNPEPERVQGAFVSDEEVSAVVEYLKENYGQPEYNEEVTKIEEPVDETVQSEDKMSKSEKKSEFDEYFADAARFVVENRRAAAGTLQRKFSIGFNRAGRIIDQLEKAGIVGASAGTKPRDVLVAEDQLEKILISLGMSESGDNELSQEFSTDVSLVENGEEVDTSVTDRFSDTNA